MSSKSSIRSAAAAAAFLAPVVVMGLRATTLHAQTAVIPLAHACPPASESSPAKEIWVDEVGSGFRSNIQSVKLSLGGICGIAQCGSREAHNMALASLAYGRTIGPVLGAGNWYRGNFEIQLELFGGAQFDPTTDWIVGL